MGVGLAGCLYLSVPLDHWQPFRDLVGGLSINHLTLNLGTRGSYKSTSTSEARLADTHTFSA